MGQRTNLKVGDREPVLQATLTQADGTAVNLAGESVAFRMTSLDGNTTITGTATITGASTGQVEYRWGASDTATAGVYRAQFTVTHTDGKEQSFPADDDLEVVIRPRP